jgi:RNA polymerase sigma-70 factor (ECF subfamily)
MLSTSPSLLERLHDGQDSQAWQRLVTAYEPWLRGWLTRAGLQVADGDDLLQDILLAISQHLPKFEHSGRPGAFRTWLRLILVHRLRHFQRTQRNRQAVLAPQAAAQWLEQLADAESALSQEWDREHDQQLLRRLLEAISAEFSPKTWRVFHMLVFEGRPAAEVAAHFDLQPNAVYVAKARVLARLRQEARGLVAE